MEVLSSPGNQQFFLTLSWTQSLVCELEVAEDGLEGGQTKN